MSPKILKLKNLNIILFLTKVQNVESSIPLANSVSTKALSRNEPSHGNGAYAAREFAQTDQFSLQ